MEFEKNLSLIRKRKGLSQEKLAELINVSRQTIYCYENGLNSPSLDTLKKLASALSVSVDDLLVGSEVSRLPKKLGSITLKKVGIHKGDLIYHELPNYFISLKLGAEVCFGLYDKGVRDYSYHLKTVNKIQVHDKEGYEVNVEEFDEELNPKRTFSLFGEEKDNGISYIGREEVINGVKILLTYKDKAFLDDWGIGGKNLSQPIVYSYSEDYILSYDEVDYPVIKIAYFDPSGTSDPKRTYFEVYLTDKGDSLYWKRYEKGKGKDSINVEEISYLPSYTAITDRFIIRNSPKL